MYLVAGTLIGIAGVSGLVITPIVWGGISKPTRKVFLIAESASKKTKLFLEEEKSSAPQENIKVTLKAMFDGKDVMGSFLLCSPFGKSEDYYLLKWNDSWKVNLNPKDPKTVLECGERGIHSMGEKLVGLNIKASAGNGTTELFKEVELKDCVINDLKRGELKIGEKMFQLICKEVWAQAKGSNKKVEIFSTGYVSI